MTKCRNRGMDSTSRAATAIAMGLGPINEDSQLCESAQDIVALLGLRKR